MNKRRIGYAIMVFSLISCFVIDAAMAGTLPRFEWPFGGIVLGGNPSNSQDSTYNDKDTTGQDATEPEPEVKPEDLEPVQAETKKAINDMTKAFVGAWN